MGALVNYLRSTGLLLLFFLLAIPAFAGAPTWVKEVLKTEVSGEVVGEAPAVILLQYKESKIKSGGDIVSTVRRVVKILSKDGVDYHLLSERVSSQRKIDGLQGWLIKPTGKETKLEKNDRIEVATKMAAGYYDDARVLSTGFDNVESGDIVAYEYTVEQKSFGANYHDEFQFQVSLPVHRAVYAVEIPRDWQIHTLPQFLDPISYHSESNIHTWTARDLAFRESETYMPSWEQLSRTLAVKAYDPGSAERKDADSWNEVSRWVLSLHKGKTDVTDSLASLAALLCSDAATRADTISSLAYYVRDKIRYVAVEMNEGGVEPRAAAITCSNQYGDCKDKVTLLRALFDAVDISSVPILINTESTVDPDFPSPWQFNHVIIGIQADEDVLAVCDPGVQQNGQTLFDPTDDRFALGQLSNSLRGRNALPLTDTTSGLLWIPKLAPLHNRRRYVADVRITAALGLEAEIRVTDFGNWGAQEAYDHRSEESEDRMQDWIKRFARCVQNPILTDLVTGTDADSAWITCTLRGENYLAKTGDLYLLKADLFHADQADELKRGERLHPVTFGSPATIETNITWHCPPDLFFEMQADTLADSCDIAAISTVALADSSSFAFTSTISYSGGWAEPAAYEDARSFVRARLAAYRLRAVLLH